MKYKLKNKTKQPIKLIINNEEIILPGDKSMTIDDLTEQAENLRKMGLLSIRRVIKNG